MADASEESLITDQMRALVGVESASWSNEIDKTWIRMFARSVGHTDPVYYDYGAATEAGFRSIPCPPGYLGAPSTGASTVARRSNTMTTSARVMS